MAEGRTNSGIGRLVVTGGAVEKHISSIFAKLGLPPSDDEHRRVKAVLARLQPWRPGQPRGPGRMLAHEIAHRQVFRSRRRSELVGRLLGNFGIGG